MAFSKRLKKEKKSIKVSFNITDAILTSLFTESSLITREYLKKIREFYNFVNKENYKNDPDLYIRIVLIEEILRYALDEKVRDFLLIYESILNNSSDKDKIIEVSENIRENVKFFSNQEILFLNNFIRSQIRYSYLLNYATDFSELSGKILSEDYDNFSEIAETFNKKIREVNTLLILNKKKDKFESENFYTKDEDFKDNLDETLKKINSEEQCIKTGIRKLNDLFGGGFKKQNLYCIFAVPEKWKSGFLLNTVLWGAKYNDFIPKDKTKTPTILYLNLENSKRQTLERKISYLFGDIDSKTLTSEKIYDKMVEEKIIKDNLNISFVYNPSQSLDINDIKDIIEKEEEENNNEVCFLVVDYLRRIASNRLEKYNSDPYIDLGNKTDDLANLAKELDIPIVTASQLNRSADELVEKYEESEQGDVGKKLNRSKSSDSRRIVDNIDYGISINIEYNTEEELYYLTILSIKHRGKRSKNLLKYFTHPFEKNNGMRLVEDVNLNKSASKKSVYNEDSSDRKNKLKLVQKASIERFTYSNDGREIKKNIIEDFDER